MPFYVVNTATDERGRIVPDIPAGVSWVGNLYQKQGNVYKYLLKTPDDLTGLPGVFGPITQSQIADAIAADGGTTRGWVVDDAPSWGITGAPPYESAIAQGSVAISGSASAV